MTVDKIIPCICTDHPPYAGDSCYYGMPQLKISGNYIPHKQFFTAFCPNCGRGGAEEFNSPYLALKDWNNFQEGLYEYHKREVIYYEDLDKHNERVIKKISDFIIQESKKTAEEFYSLTGKRLNSKTIGNQIVCSTLDISKDEYYDFFDEVMKMLIESPEIFKVEKTESYSFKILFKTE